MGSSLFLVWFGGGMRCLTIGGHLSCFVFVSSSLRSLSPTHQIACAPLSRARPASYRQRSPARFARHRPCGLRAASSACEPPATLAGDALRRDLDHLGHEVERRGRSRAHAAAEAGRRVRHWSQGQETARPPPCPCLSRRRPVVLWRREVDL